MLVIIVLAMALFVGLFILVAGVLCLTRYYYDLCRLTLFAYHKSTILSIVSE